MVIVVCLLKIIACNAKIDGINVLSVDVVQLGGKTRYLLSIVNCTLFILSNLNILMYFQSL